MLRIYKKPSYDGWLFEKVNTTLRRVDAGKTALYDHKEALVSLRKRVKTRLNVKRG